MGNISSQNSPADYVEQRKKEEARTITIIAIVVMTGFASLLVYMFFGH